MLRKSFAFAVLAVVASMVLCASSSAAILGTATLIKNPAGVPFGAPDAALPSPWQSYVLSVSGNAGETIQAIETNMSGSLHQRWDDSDFDGDPTNNPTANSTNKVNGDTHLLAPSGSLFGSGPTENNPGTGSPLANPDPTARIYGVGNLLQGAWALTGVNVGSTADVAYLVIDPTQNTLANFSIAVKVANPVGETLANLTYASFVGLPVLGGGGGNLPPDVTDAIQNVTLDTTIPIALTNFAFQMLATDDNQPTPGLTWALQNFTGPGAPTTAPALSAGGNFTWTPDGSKGGQYIATVRATDNGGLSADGTLTINLTVPEPTTLSLLGLALVGCVGIARRRG